MAGTDWGEEGGGDVEGTSVGVTGKTAQIVQQNQGVNINEKSRQSQNSFEKSISHVDLGYRNRTGSGLRVEAEVVLQDTVGHGILAKDVDMVPSKPNSGSNTVNKKYMGDAGSFNISSKTSPAINEEGTTGTGIVVKGDKRGGIVPADAGGRTPVNGNIGDSSLHIFVNGGRGSNSNVNLFTRGYVPGVALPSNTAAVPLPAAVPDSMFSDHYDEQVVPFHHHVSQVRLDDYDISPDNTRYDAATVPDDYDVHQQQQQQFFIPPHIYHQLKQQYQQQRQVLPPPQQQPSPQILRYLPQHRYLPTQGSQVPVVLQRQHGHLHPVLGSSVSGRYSDLLGK